MTEGLTWVLFLGAVAVLIGLVALSRRSRISELQRRELADEHLDRVRIRLLEYVKRHSYTMGTWVPLAKFWRNEKVRRDGDRGHVLAPLLDEALLLVPASPSGIDGLAHKAVHWFALPLPDRVVLHELAFRRMYQGEPLIVEHIEIAGDWVMGDQDKSITKGDRAGGDIVGGDKTGRDKAGRDAYSVNAAGNMVGSGNVGTSRTERVAISTPTRLSEALRELELEAQARGEDLDVVAALQWAATAAVAAVDPDRREQSAHQRALDRSSGWVRGALGAIAEGVTGALTEHWLVEMLRG